MRQFLEIETKSKITKSEYDLLINSYDLSSRIFQQVNFYFDTPTLTLLNNKITLRIRRKDKSLKLTLKSKQGDGSLEKHIDITKEECIRLINSTFDTSTYFKELNYKVSLITKLDTYRVTMPYKDGIIFIDKNKYNDIVDYEIEYEHSNYQLCQENLQRFLTKHGIKYQDTDKKSYRALMSAK